MEVGSFNCLIGPTKYRIVAAVEKIRPIPHPPEPVPLSSQPVTWEPALQPFLHDRCIVIHAPSLVVSAQDGQIAGPADGFYHEDLRALSRLVISARGIRLVPIGWERDGGSASCFRGVLRGLGEHTADPAVTLERRRRAGPSRFDERLIIANHGRQTVRLRLQVEAAADFAPISDVKSGRGAAAVTAMRCPGGLDWQYGGSVVSIRMRPDPDMVDAPAGGLGADITLPPGGVWEATLAVTVSASRPALFGAYPGPAPWTEPQISGVDPRLAALVDVSMADLGCLLLADPESAPGSADRESAHGSADLFVAAGAPWFLTLFGRDSLWAARMLLPLSTDLAAGTLRTLARRQGTRSDTGTGEEPGKILHEVRVPRPTLAPSLPPRYYGTIDATPLWLILLRDAWRWGLPADQVEPLLGPASAALAWMRDHGDADGDGLLEYLDVTGRGLANQGWRDSGDAILWHDGRLAEGPIALAEVQAYAYQGAWAGAELLESFGRGGAGEWREWAEALKARFHASFWIEGRLGPMPAVALDGQKRPVDSGTSALGHLLGTGLLDPGQEDLAAAYLASPELDSRFGLRTLGTDAAGFNPLGYHTGSVWPHDTAIAASGLARSGHPATAWSLIDGVLEAAETFGYRLPELFAGYGRPARRPGTRYRHGTRHRPSPYPAACHPQAWAAAASVSFVQTLLGLEADAPGRTVTVAPLPGGSFPLQVTGIRLGDQPVSIDVGGDGSVRSSAPAGVTVRSVGGAARADQGRTP